MWNQNLWFHDLTYHQVVDCDALEEIVNYIFQRLINQSSSDDHLSKEIKEDKLTRCIFLTISSNKTSGKVYIGFGNGYLQAIQEALSQINLNHIDGETCNLKVDIVYQVNSLESFDISKKIKFERSLYGLAFDDKIRLAFLPEQLVSKTIVNTQKNIKLTNIIKNFILNDNQKKMMLERKNFTLYFFQCKSYFKSKSYHGTLYRGHRIFDKIEPKELINAALFAGNYLQTIVTQKGDFQYEYLPKKNQYSHKYNILRHAGTIYAMLELYEFVQSEKLLEIIKITLSSLMNRIKSIEINHHACFCIVENDFVKLGANALALLALSKYISVTKESSLLEKAKKLALWLQATQDLSGNFSIHKMNYFSKEKSPFVSHYYPGEAIFSLARFYQVDPNPAWLEVAQKGANYIIHVRDKNKQINELEHDHWLLYGLNELYQFYPEIDYINHAIKISKAIMQAQKVNIEEEDFRGSFYADGRSTPTAIRSEGLAAAFKLLNQNQYHVEADETLECIKRCVQFQLQTQFYPERTLYLPKPSRALGGFSKSLTDFSIRIDYLQHNISSLLALYQILDNKS